jgi:hypothetical protein
MRSELRRFAVGSVAGFQPLLGRSRAAYHAPVVPGLYRAWAKSLHTSKSREKRYVP